ncbi:alpha/beta hydrolase, partial [Achromobacter ruhlandii]|nr:alpha/beta hydrolase [Achromobacter ruhlandii]
MPLLTIGNAELHFDIQGQGDALLALAPGGMLSHRELWR